MTTTREELRGWSKRLGDNYDLIKKSRKTVVDIKDSIVNTQQYVRNRIVKHMGVLSSCMRRREVVLKCEVDDKTKRKLELLDAQERYENPPLKLQLLRPLRCGSFKKAFLLF